MVTNDMFLLGMGIVSVVAMVVGLLVGLWLSRGKQKKLEARVPENMPDLIAQEKQEYEVAVARRKEKLGESLIKQLREEEKKDGQIRKTEVIEDETGRGDGGGVGGDPIRGLTRDRTEAVPGTIAGAVEHTGERDKPANIQEPVESEAGVPISEDTPIVEDDESIGDTEPDDEINWEEFD